MALTMNRTPVPAVLPVYNTVSGSIVSISNAKAGNAKSVIADINPVQSGSGDPSPTNIRPISGWTGANVYRTGKNILSPMLYNGGIYHPTVGTTWTLTESVEQLTDNHDGTFSYTFGGTSWVYKTLIVPVMGLSQIHIKFSIKSTGQLGTSYGYLTHDFKVVNKTSSTNATQTINVSGYPTTYEDAAYFYILYTNKGSTTPTITITEPQVELGLTATTYEPYSGTTYPISWQSSVGTVYGGTVNVATGKLTVTDVCETLTADMIVAQRYTDGALSSFKLNIPTLSDVGGANNYKQKSNRFVTVSQTEGNPYAWVKTHTNSIFWGNLANDASANFLLHVNVNGQAISLADFKQYVTDNTTQVMANLATPLEYDLTPTAVTMLAGNNNLWSDTGDIEVTYRVAT